jgi:hypothetical protein
MVWTCFFLLLYIYFYYHPVFHVEVLLLCKFLNCGENIEKM